MMVDYKIREKRTSTQNFSTKPGAVETVARADKNQQSPRAPWIISFESAAPPTKNWGLSKICVTRWTSAGERFSLLCNARPYKHLFLSFSKSNSISLQPKYEVLCSKKGNYYRSYLNFLFFARQSLAIRCTLVLQYSIAFSSSFVTSKPPCSFARWTAGSVVVSTVVTTVVVMVNRGARPFLAFPW